MEAPHDAFDLTLSTPGYDQFSHFHDDPSVLRKFAKEAAMTPPRGLLHSPRLHPSAKNLYCSPERSPRLIHGFDGQFQPLNQTQESELIPSNKLMLKDDCSESRSRSANVEEGWCERQEYGAGPPRRKRYHRHTLQQTQKMEMFFKECTHPDIKQRMELSRELGLEPRQVMYWFQNRRTRTQEKAKQGRSENSMPRMENEKLHFGNTTIREDTKNMCFSNCGGASTLGGIMTADGHQLGIENERLKEELERMSALPSKYLGRPASSSTTHQHQTASSCLDLAMNGSTASLASRSVHASLAQGPGGVDNGTRSSWSFTETEKPLVAELAVAAMDELWHKCQPEETAWLARIDGSQEIVDHEKYIRMFGHSLGLRAHGLKKEATRETGLVAMPAINLVENLLDTKKWVEMFPCIISRAFTIDALSTGVADGNRHGALQLMYAELQVLSPLVPTRELYFLRYCKQYTESIWAVVDVSIDTIRDDLHSQLRCRRLPSGFLIQGMPNGSSKGFEDEVTVVDHMEYNDRAVNFMYRTLVNSGMAFGAQRWLSNLQRQCERLACLTSPNISAVRNPQVTPNYSGQKSILKLAQRMCRNFCVGVSPSTIHTWTTLFGTGKYDVQVMTRKVENSLGEHNGIVLSAATSLWLPAPPAQVFEFLRDERLRSKWDLLSDSAFVQEIVHLPKGQDPRNSVSLMKLNALNPVSCTMLILQEISTDVCGSFVVYCPIDIQAMDVLIQGGDTTGVCLLPSGFAILPDGPLDPSPLHHHLTADYFGTGGSLLTVAFQTSNTPSTKPSLESITTLNGLISSTVQKIKSAFGCDQL